MPTLQINRIIQHLRRAVLLRDGDGLADGQLLECFSAQGEEAAFEALVRRHGPMVLGVCRRVLGNYHDAEDAFQATFLVLVRKAASIRPPGMVGNWLYGVAYQTALKVRAGAMKRRGREKQMMDMPEPEVPQNLWRDLQPLLDQELTRLPDKFRIPLVLCDLEGKTRKEAARRLGWPEGTLSSRLARARRMLAKRLSRHGVALSGGALAMLLSQNAASAGAPSSLVVSTVQAAMMFAAGKTAAGVISAQVAALTEGVLQAMFLSKLKIATALVLVVAFLGWSGGLLMEQALAEKPGRGQETPLVVAQKDAEKKAAGASQGTSTDLNGLLKVIDPKKNIITVLVPPQKKGEPGEEKTFDLAKEIKVFFDDGKSSKAAMPWNFRVGSLADLKEGVFVQAQVGANRKEVVAILGLGPTVSGMVKAIDGEKNTITLTPGGKKREDEQPDKTYLVAKEARVFIDGKEAKLTNLATETLVTAKLSGDQKEIGFIQAQGPTVQGVLKALDSEKNVLTVTIPKKGEPPTDKTYPIAKDAKVVLYNKEATIKNLALETPVTLKLSGFNKEVAMIQVQGPIMQGVLKAVDAAKNTVTVVLSSKTKSQPGEEKTFRVVKDAHIEITEGKTGRLSDLEKDRPVILWLSLNQEEVVGISSGKGKKTKN